MEGWMVIARLCLAVLLLLLWGNYTQGPHLSRMLWTASITFNTNTALLNTNKRNNIHHFVLSQLFNCQHFFTEVDLTFQANFKNKNLVLSLLSPGVGCDDAWWLLNSGSGLKFVWRPSSPSWCFVVRQLRKQTKSKSIMYIYFISISKAKS